MKPKNLTIMYTQIKVGGDGGGKKKKQIKVSKSIKPTSEQLEQANQLARRIAVNRGLLSGENTHTGGRIPEFVEEGTGRILKPGDVATETTMLDTKVPPYVKSLEWDSKTNLPYYIDEKTGDSKYVAKELFYLPRFRKSTPLSSMTSIVKK